MDQGGASLPSRSPASGAGGFGRRRAAALRIGRRGERAAARTLSRRGYRVLARNLRTPRGEVDLLALDGEALVVVEVKTRARARGAAPEWRLGVWQRRRLVSASRWLARRGDLRGKRLRVDVVGVTFDGCRPVVTIRRDVAARAAWREDR